MTDDSDFAAVRDGLRLQMFDATELGILDLTMPKDEMPYVQFVAGELYVGVRMGDDGPASVAQVEGWGVAFADALQSALSSTPPLEVDAVQGVAEITEEEQAAAILVDPSRAERLNVEGDLVVTRLAQAHVIVTGADDERGFERALEAAEELIRTGTRLASIHPIGNPGAKWFPFPWRERFPALAERITRVTREFGIRAYAEQKSALDAGEVRVLEPKLERLDTGVTVTFATWLSGTAALLPVVDNVIIASRQGALGVMGFAEFIEQAGDRVMRTELAPIRYFVSEGLELSAS
ncbi:hypothetical protein [Microbacterium sp. SD291]|uniref:hypothetical protein n=1 Tax=Microbacterium sp. SD291 TaxID=2782007 RepID=UPI001A95DCF8|nr:hypothetical protein [Microbacterium sp. SD291]MBO0981428.1 hypothetical protein [Microbacterium sp. SD291]